LQPETSPPEQLPDPSEPSKTKGRFLYNALWSWLGVAVNLFAGFILSPYIIRKLGLEGYGIWALVFSITGYYNLLDLGFRSAVVRYTAYYRARGESEQVNVLLNTTLAYFSCISFLLILVTLALAPHVGTWFHISPRFLALFPKLVLLIGLNLAIGVTFNTFTGCVEGFQRFDISNGIWVATFSIRHPGCALLLYMGYGLVEMAALVLFTQILAYISYAVACKRIFPSLRIGRRYVESGMLRRTASFGVHTFVAGLASQSLDQTPSLLIGRLQSVEQLGFYNLPVRLLQYAAEGVSRIGLIVAPRAAELFATGQKETIGRLAVFANRYCLILYVPFTIFLLHYGPELLRVWLKERGAEVALQSGPLLPVLLAGTTLGLAAQFCSSTVLVGMSRHQVYSWALACEAVLSVVLMIYALPAYGIFGAAVIASSLILIVRGLFAPWLLSNVLEISFFSYMSGIYSRPLLAAVPVWLLGWWLRASLLEGRNWSELFLAGGMIAVFYFGLAFFFCLESDHRDKLLRFGQRYLKVGGGGA